MPYKYCKRDASRWLYCLVSERDEVKVVFDGDADGDMVGGCAGFCAAPVRSLCLT